MAELVMPSLGADMEAGTLVRWLKQPGEAVRRGDVVAEVETDKGVIDIDVFSSGVIGEILVRPGQRVPVGTRLATIRESVDTKPSVAPAETPKPEPPPQVHEEPQPVQLAPPQVASAASPVTRAGGPTRAAISPAARRLAHELGVDPTSIHGSGAHGAVTRDDIERAAPKPAGHPAPAGKPKPVDDQRAVRMRNAIAAAMAKSKREIPHYYLSTTIDMQPAMNWLAEENHRRPITDRLLYGVLLLKATALALREVPELNAIWNGKHASPLPDVHVGVAVSLRGGLIAPAIHNTDKLSLAELMRAFRDLVMRARSGGLRSSELAEPTITVTSLGETGAESVLGVIYPPQVALVGFGKVMERPWSINGGLLSRQIMTATLAADHRVSDGHRGSIFLNVIAQLLQEPDKL